MAVFLLILVVGVFAGFLNTLAAGGSLITLPMLIFLGLPAAMANGTNRVALFVQSGVAIWNFRRNGFFDWKLGLLFGIPAIFGSILGAQMAINTPDEAFNKILGIIMIVALLLTIKPPKRKTVSEEGSLTKAQKIIAFIAFFFIGIYGGFIQAGIGFIIIAFNNILLGMSLVKTNSIKVFVMGLFITASLVTFIISGNVHWTYGLILAIGNGIGAWFGSNFAVKKGDKVIKIFLVITVSVMSLKLLLGY